ncbi:hypothetical protein [Halosimplex halophilum]|uniref:hypothetical protein n=1 Tax=Halosimplex halophilum TaxID=2559572 RepID=UPI00107EF42F|nr:hypothetical protein [Halosimplex halophilum]
MDRLSSCYFCGAAPDATLEEHPVVPESLDPTAETQTTVVLCRTCARKLDAVLDSVVGAVEDGGVTADTGSGGDAANADTASGEGGPEDDLESTLGDDEEILTPLGDDESTAEEAAEASEMEFGDDREGDEADADTGSDDGGGSSKARKYTRSRGAGFRKEDDDTAESGSLTGGAFDDGDDASPGRSTASDGESRDPLAGGSTDESAESGSGTSGPESGAGGSSPDDESGGQSSGGQSSGGSSGGDTSGSDGDGDHRVSMTRLENTKVMRLLENREFPVDKEEFVVVAANAYQVSRSDCEKVIDLAVEHGLLREEDGQLYGGDA